MLFNSIAFLVFLPITLIAYFWLKHRRQNVLLLIASYFFYGWWDVRFLSLLLLSTVVDYHCARGIAASRSPRRRRAYLLVSIVVNLGCLGFFKYFNFFADSAELLLQSVGLKASFVTLNVVLPVGISFYTFQSLSYTFDVYRGNGRRAKNLLDFAVFVSFFPQLVAGPIERANRLLPQIEGPRVYRSEQFIDGIWLILLGYFKKTVIADQCAGIVDAAFSGSALPFNNAASWIFLYAFAFQIYGDFSGYTDIARGVAKLMGFELNRNFRMPYLVSSPSEFWRNWHISLSTWLRDYVYITMGGNRRGPLRTNLNLLATMLLGGLWHGAGWAFVIWGAFHGLLLGAFRGFKANSQDSANGIGARMSSSFLLRTIGVVLFFHVTCIGWLIFRAGGIPNMFDQLTFVVQSLRGLFTWQWTSEIPIAVFVRCACIPFAIAPMVFLVQYFNEEMETFHCWKTKAQAIGVAALCVMIMAFGKFDGVEFIYFAF